MSANGFREDELVSRKVKVGNEWQTRVFPIIGGRLRLAHEENQNLNLQTEMVSWDGQYAIFKCSAVTNKVRFVGYGTANNQRDSRLAECLIELAETLGVARALRFAGFGLEFTGAEEVANVTAAEPEREQSANKRPVRMFSEGAMATEQQEGPPKRNIALRAGLYQKRQVTLLVEQLRRSAVPCTPRPNGRNIQIILTLHQRSKIGETLL
ncbi:MAG: hypothetical protein HY912_22220, partial [Desulfomonile tiedjei]|nr:hypothetical protein [Desulfomonile tiedjei]